LTPHVVHSLSLTELSPRLTRLCRENGKQAEALHHVGQLSSREPSPKSQLVSPLAVGEAKQSKEEEHTQQPSDASEKQAKEEAARVAAELAQAQAQVEALRAAHAEVPCGVYRAAQCALILSSVCNQNQSTDCC
jgi:hypothetical protein